MSTGKAAARDIRYGRRGGRWADEGSTRADDALASIAAMREKTIAAHERDPKKNPPWPSLVDDVREPKTDEEWAGRARMARARQAAGVHLDHLDRVALRRVDGAAS